jgi:uncharacterized protein with PQ loop repeat
MSNFEIIEDGNELGKVLLLKGDWSSDVASYMIDNQTYSLRLSHPIYFKGHDISFLSTLSFLKGLELYCWEAKGIEVIESLPQLELIGLENKSTRKIDLSAFSKLRIAMIRWSKGLDSLFALRSLEKLNIINYPYTDLEPVSSMNVLEKLYLTSRKLESLKGVECLSNLKLLDLCYCPNLTSLTGTENNSRLKTIEIEACRHISKQRKVIER